MTFTSAFHRYPMLVLAFFVSYLLIVSPGIFQTIVLAYIIFAMNTSFQLDIEDGRLLYKVILFRSVLFTRQARPEEIEEIQFKLHGFAQRLIKVRKNKGLSLRLLHFKPTNIDRHILTFAKRHQVPVDTGKNYGNISLD
ncbi:hypothetical protein H0266_02250 [Halobacillus locisalis]|uniref:PH domain-containing protein n=1 Tax=Halobacillus locisalis TaxID=220753 RepID=A0A838CP49_9BACI|nr:hypothetical protein [Halobacillus locisalis]MBA2173711.1 hypothetical protein [Halobacillus locisalis]